MRARPLALCGVLTALAVVLLCLGAVIPAAMLCAPILAMAVLLPVLEELGPRAAGTAYAAAAILALLLVTGRRPWCMSSSAGIPSSGPGWPPCPPAPCGWG